MTDAPDPTRCPLCGQSNQCGQCDPASAQQPCWCFNTDIAPETREQIPPEAKGKACLCSRCARGEQSAKP
ncbi:cysteine-rich CWC family protein [Pseudomonas sp. Q2-TVG4-2]|uniref:cysteine-rich CWC family protein n=1 Tax=Pseudomonas sp. Q2-TVG4-2 TaxID=1685699 RepID=UPI0015E65FD3|nr:cysteine-rich CWC family protein [Pseudomonas sp. Q2-TVG4-2]